MSGFPAIPVLTAAQAAAMKSGSDNDLVYIDKATRVLSIVNSLGVVKEFQSGGVAVILQA